MMLLFAAISLASRLRRHPPPERWENLGAEEQVRRLADEKRRLLELWRRP